MSAPTAPPVTRDDGLEVLGAGDLRLLRRLDALFLDRADAVGAQERRYPFLLEPRFLDGIDYYDNFPHLGLAVSRVDPGRLAGELAGTARPVAAVPASALHDAAYALPSAACYAIYQHLRGTTVPAEGSRHTTVATCFRNEERYAGLRRLLGFSMREIVFVGTPDGAQAHLLDAKAWVLGLAERLGLAMTVEVATDPFFDRSGSRARMQRLFPVKEEFVVDGLAIGSVNYHRNFFGERCDITLPDGSPVHTACLAFGLERWVHVLASRFGDAAADELTEA